MSRKFDFGFRMDLMVKDIVNCMRLLDEKSIPAPLLRQVHEMFLLAQQECGVTSEHMEAIRWIETMMGVTLQTTPNARDTNRQLKNKPTIHNFSPGPGMLPDSVMKKAQREFCDFKDSGMGIIETTNLDALGASHPGIAKHAGQQMILDTSDKLRNLLNIPSNFKILFMWGGAVGQFSAVPLNLLDNNTKADYVDMGFWSRRAATEAAKYCDVHVPVVLSPTSFRPIDKWNIRGDTAYVHICLNETVEGFELIEDIWNSTLPPLVADATSTLLSRPIQFSKYGMVYASGGKNIPAGVTVVIIRDDLLARESHAFTPQIMDYNLNGGALSPISSPFESRPNTPPIFGIYMLGLVCDFISESHKSLYELQKWVISRAQMIYNIIDNSDGFYCNTVDNQYRSRMSIVIRIGNDNRHLENLFIKQATEQGLYNVFGHPVSGGLRISLYIGVPDDSITAICKFMTSFMKQNETISKL
jgi:phosphoserine aminotransferase